MRIFFCNRLEILIILIFKKFLIFKENQKKFHLAFDEREITFAVKWANRHHLSIKVFIFVIYLFCFILFLLKMFFSLLFGFLFK